MKDVESNSVIVRHVPLMLIESPRWASVRISAQSETVREVPLPPDWEGSSSFKAVTAGHLLSASWTQTGVGQEPLTADRLDEPGEHLYRGPVAIQRIAIFEPSLDVHFRRERASKAPLHTRSQLE